MGVSRQYRAGRASSLMKIKERGARTAYKTARPPCRPLRCSRLSSRSRPRDRGPPHPPGTRHRRRERRRPPLCVALREFWSSPVALSRRRDRPPADPVAHHRRSAVLQTLPRRPRGSRPRRVVLRVPRRPARAPESLGPRAGAHRRLSPWPPAESARCSPEAWCAARSRSSRTTSP